MRQPNPVPLNRHSILQRAKSGGVDGEEALRDIFFHQLLARIVVAAPDAFVLKGAQALKVRGVTRRATTDIDLAARLELDAARAALQEALAVDLGDGVLYQERAAPRALAGEATSPARGLHLSLQAILDGRALPIGVDLVVDLSDTGNSAPLQHHTLVSAPGVIPVEFNVYDVPSHLSDKIAATLATYGGGRPSSRTKDLYDICAIALRCTLDGGATVLALRAELARRGLESMLRFAVPSAMTSGWAHFIEGLNATDSVPIDANSAVELANRLADPLLSGNATGATWNPTRQRWER